MEFLQILGMERNSSSTYKLLAYIIAPIIQHVEETKSFQLRLPDLEKGKSCVRCRLFAVRGVFSHTPCRRRRFSVNNCGLDEQTGRDTFHWNCDKKAMSILIHARHTEKKNLISVTVSLSRLRRPSIASSLFCFFPKSTLLPQLY